MGEKLRPCPFCGPEGRVVAVRDAGTMIECETCGLEMYIEFWQKRPAEDALMAEIDKLRARYTGPLTEKESGSVWDIVYKMGYCRAGLEGIKFDTAIRRVRAGRRL